MTKDQLLKLAQEELRKLTHSIECNKGKVAKINHILEQIIHNDEVAPKLEKFQHEQLEQEAKLKSSNLPPLEVPSTEAGEPQEPFTEDTTWLQYHEQGKYGVE